MYYTVNVNYNGMEPLLRGSNANGFKKCCISTAIDETDGDMWRNGCDEDADVSSECEEEEGADCEDRQ